MKVINNSTNIIYTNSARCRDCYRCVRECPVHAIKFKDDQANVEIENCILCGTCIKECPQDAKSFRNDLERAERLLKNNDKVAVSIAPAFASFFSPEEIKRIPTLMRKLGFCYVGETAEGAYHTAEATASYFKEETNQSILATACPSFINFIEKYNKEFLPNLAPVVSPMIAHAKILKKRLGSETKNVFVGPCLAKKGEAEREEFSHLIDVVLTFEELQTWIDKEGIDFSKLEESTFDNEPVKFASLFPLLGGLTKTASMGSDLLADKTLSVSGVDEIRESLEFIKSNKEPILIEPLVCKSGCVNGPGVVCDLDIYSRRKKVIEYSRSIEEVSKIPEPENLNLKTYYSEKKLNYSFEFDENLIEAILEETGKAKIEDQLNCGACGYETCRLNAIAVLSGMAAEEMCIPYMRRKAEQRADKIMESSPNGIIIIDEHLNIIHMNPAFKNLFMCSNSLYGKRISELMDPEPFISIRGGDKKIIEFTKKHNRYNITCHQILYKLEDENQYVGVFVDITKSLSNSEKFDKLRVKTILQAEELMNHQIEMAQNIAKFLGESTAKGEELVDNLIKLTENNGKKSSNRSGEWLKDIYTSK
ncbi:MAG: 4Fe-4S binding protein [Ignavibacteriae bacterium]|nr:4Fe-4S dicluster domain-containing protein [Ignavibacteriota bacterium]NOG96355.1 4Fe-4S binding protein [Ignavibacteriota bacterium]